MPYRLALSCCLVLLLAGCNAFEALAPESTQPEALLADAQIALASGRPGEAVDLLRQAMEQTPDNPVIRTKLSTALLAQRGVNVLDFMRMADLINDDAASEGHTASLRPTAAQGVCTFPASHAQERFDPTALEEFEQIEASTEVFLEITQLLDDVLGSASSSVELQAAVDYLRERGMSRVEIAEALIDRAVAHSALAFVAIAQRGAADLTFHYVTAPDGDRYIGYCAPDQVTLDALRRAVACHLADLDYARLLIRSRAELLASDRSRRLADQIDAAYAALVRTVNASCSAGTWSVL